MASTDRPVQVTDSLDDLGDNEFIHAALRQDVEAIRLYGQAHPESWTGLRFENEPRVRIVASFVGDLERHDSELRRLLPHPDRLVLEQSRWSKSQLDDIASEIHSTLRQRQAMTGRPVMARLGVGIDVVSVGLQADQEEVAEELAQRYGDAVELAVGAFGFPMGRERSQPRSPRGPNPKIVEIKGLEVRLHPERRVFEVGDRGQADLVVRNVSTHHVGRFHCGQPLLAVLVDESGQVLGGNAPAAIAGTGRSIDLNRYDSPGQEFATTALQRPQPRAPWPSVRAWTADQSDDRVSVRSAETAREARPGQAQSGRRQRRSSHQELPSTPPLPRPRASAPRSSVRVGAPSPRCHAARRRGQELAGALVLILVMRQGRERGLDALVAGENACRQFVQGPRCSRATAFALLGFVGH
jgi:hypothetical protein